MNTINEFVSLLTRRQAFSLVATIGLIIVSALLTWLLIHRYERKARERLQKRPGYAPVPTKSPVSHPLRKAKEKALQSIVFRFSIMRHAVVFFLVVILAVLLVVLLAGTVPAAVISTSVAATGIILGIAARPMLENFVSGVMMTFSGSVNVGDTVIIDDRYGTVEDITLTHTVVKLWNWWRHVYPNSVLMSKSFINLTLYDSYQWCHVEFWISHEADLGRVRTEAVEAAKRHPKNADYESPRFWVMEMGKEGIRCWIAAWADNPGDAWDLSNGIRTELTTRLSKLKIYPHRFNIGFDQPEGSEMKTSN